jgi:outer membrane usher protein
VSIGFLLGPAVLPALLNSGAVPQGIVPPAQNRAERGQQYASAAAANQPTPPVVVPLPGRTPSQTPVPLPTQPGPVTPPTPVPLPSTEPIVPQVPIGPHGRPDINPYERDIEMTVPLTFQSRSLGEIPMKLTADDRFLLESATFVRLMRTVLNEPAQRGLASRLSRLESFGPDDLNETGVELTYDPSTLAVVVVQVSPEQRAIENIFAPPRDDLNDITLLPATFSAYLNINAAQTYLWGEEDTDPPSINLDGAIRYRGFVFEADASLAQDFGLNGDSYRFQRNYARLVYDQPGQFRRWFAGDLDPEIRGQQSFVQMGGVGVLRQQRRFNTFRSAILQGNRTFVLQRESTVRFLRNGALYREVRLQPGSYDFSSLPLLSGSNDIQIEVRDNSGAVQNLSFQQYLDPIDLDPGDYEYGAYLGPTSQQIGRAPDYRGPIAFTGFFRKAFFNRPALGVGLQLSERVQTVTGQTQFVLGNGGRVLIDAAGSNSQTAGVGYSVGISYDQFFDRGGLADNFTIRADYVSTKYATLGNPDAFNSKNLSVSGQYTRQFSQSLIATVSGSYIKGRDDLGDSYRVAATGYYRLNDRWTLRAGVDYARLPTTFSNLNGFSANFGLVFQPDYRRRAEARYETRGNLAELSYAQSGLNELNSVGFGGVVAHEDGSLRAQGFAGYSGNRFDATVSHATLGSDLSTLGEVNATSVRVGTTLAFADGVFGIGRRINDSFALVYPHRNLGKRSVVAGQSLAENNYIGRSGALGAAVNNFLGSYITQSVQYDVQDPPTGYDTGPGVARVRPPYRSGYALRVGTDAFVSAVGNLVRANGPVALIGGRVTLLDVREGENPQPIPFFTNSVGRFAIANLLPGRRYRVETYGSDASIDRSFEFAVPAETDGLVDLGTVMSGGN